MSDDEEDKHAAIRAKRRSMLDAKAQLKKAQHGFTDLPEPVLCEYWQTEVFAFMDEIAAQRDQPNIEMLWRQPIEPDLDIYHSLDDVYKQYFQTNTIDTYEWDHRTKERVRTTTEIVTKLEVEELRILQSALEQCYTELGYEEPPKRGLGTSGSLKYTRPDVVEDAVDAAIRETAQESAKGTGD